MVYGYRVEPSYDCLAVSLVEISESTKPVIIYFIPKERSQMVHEPMRSATAVPVSAIYVQIFTELKFHTTKFHDSGG